jgi:hypothetical protein
MTDISKYKNVSLSKDTYLKIDKIRRVMVPNKEQYAQNVKVMVI